MRLVTRLQTMMVVVIMAVSVTMIVIEMLVIMMHGGMRLGGSNVFRIIPALRPVEHDEVRAHCIEGCDKHAGRDREQRIAVPRNV